MRRFLVAILITLLPGFSHAAVLINEIAWMGTESSASDEWIELYNTGDAVEVSGWTLTDNQSLEIELSGTIGAGERVVLERTNDESAPGTAFLLYTGALNNGGRTLVLTRADGSVENVVVGGEDWEHLGGDNETKETAQRTEGGWVTAPATPGAQNAPPPTAPTQKPVRVAALGNERPNISPTSVPQEEAAAEESEEAFETREETEVPDAPFERIVIPGTEERETAERAAASLPGRGDRLPYLALAGVLTLGILAIYSRRII